MGETKQTQTQASPKQQVKETEAAADSVNKAEAPKEVPLEEHDQNLPGSYPREYGATHEDVAFADAEAAAEDAEAEAKKAESKSK